MRHEVVTTVQAPAELVWRTISTVERWPEWTPTMREVTRADTGELRVGSTAEVHQPGQPVRTWTVTELEPGRSFTWTTTGPGLRLSADHSLSGDGSGVVVTLGFTVTGILAPLTGLLAGRTIRRAVETEAASLRTWCEERS
ncbi:SRPBCC family protein [Amycolatopsis suaedae]|uniref:Polyketide cyclase n=1 Tax=Amycolatopsis suaedae TaxID=2510978 RepID=A0A4Q7J263_9PSEU|nr:SRPBCC family protein [Amycolatopsis suaedae]RZQ61520.1 polyketide cyclase [Amycolatopsis suaedae]